MPLRSSDLGPLVGDFSQPVKRVRVSDEPTENGLTILRTANDTLKVNIAKAKANNQTTALGRALSWSRLKLAEGDNIIISGPDAEEIASQL